MRYLQVLAAILALAAFTVGCGVMSPGRITKEPRIIELAASGHLPRAEKHSVAVSPVVVQLPPYRAPEGVFAASVAPDTGVIQNSFVESLRELELFKEVKKVKGGRPGSGWEAFQLSRNEGADLVLVPKVTQFNVTYEGRNNFYIPKLILWSLLEFASWVIADEKYRVDMTCEFELRRSDNSIVIARSRRHPIHTVKPVNDFQRGIKLWGMVKVPNSLTQDNFKNVASAMSSHVSREMEVSFVRNVWPSFYRKIPQQIKPPPVDDDDDDDDDGDRKPRTNMACIFGIDSYDELTLSPLKYAAADAKAFHRLLATSLHPVFAKSIFTNKSATREKMKEALKKARGISRNKKLGTFVFYFAGRGALVKEKGRSVFYLLPRDANAVDLKGTAFSLEDLEDDLLFISAERLIVILDCGFDPSGEGRSVPTRAKFLRLNFPKSLLNKSRLSLLTACPPGKPAYESNRLRHGLLTHLLLEAASNPKVLGDDHALQMNDAFKYVGDNMQDLNDKQFPRLLGPSKSNTLIGLKAPKLPEAPGQE